MKISKKLVVSTVIGLLVIGSSAGIWEWNKYKKTNTKTLSVTSGMAQSSDDVTERQIPTPPPNLDLPLPSPGTKDISSAKQVSVLLLGYGGAGHQGGFLSDVMVLLNIDLVQKKFALIHIPRDLWVNIPAGSTFIPSKINAALAMGTKSGNYPAKDIQNDTLLRGAYLSKQAVNEVTGLNVDYVVGIDFGGFKKAIDAIKGIDVHVTQILDDPWYPIRGRELELCGHSPEDVTAMSATMSGFTLEKQFPCRYEHLHFDVGLNHMDGDTALKYVSSRHSSSDFSRGERQIEVVIALEQKLLSLKVLDKIPDFFKSVANSIKTDLNIQVISDLSPTLRDLPNYQVKDIGLSTENVLVSGTSKSGASILVPKIGDGKFDEVQKYVQGEIAK